MSLYSQYVKEREGAETVKTEKGFYSYRLADNHLFIVDLYVAPEYRAEKLDSEFGKELEAIAKENGKSVILCAASTGALNASDAINFILANGYEIIKVTQQEIYFKKEI